VQDNPVSPNAGPDQTICSASTQLAATPVSGGAWSLVSGTGSFTNSALANTSVTGLSVGANVFRWTIPGGACASASDEVSIVVDAAPSASNAGTDQTICATTTTLAGNLPLVGSGFWTVVTGAATFANPSLHNTGVSGLSVGTNILRWTISNGVCPPSFDEVSIVVQDNPVSPNAGPDQTICSASTQLAATPVSGGVWSLVSGTGSFTNSALANTSVTGLSVGVNVFRWTIPGGACASAFDEVSIVVDQNPTESNAGTDQTICATTTTLAGNLPLVGSGFWTVVTGAATFANPSLHNTGVSGLSVGTNILRWTISNGVCPVSTDELSITVQDNPVSPNAGPDQTICSASTQLAATPVSGGVWSVVSGTGSFTNSALANTSVTGLSVGVNVFRWTIPGGACASAFDEVSIVVDQNPTVSNAGTDQTICATTSTLAGNLPLVGSGFWTVVSGSATFANQNINNTGVSGLAVGNNILRWTISNGVCPPSFDEVSIVVQDNPVSPNAGPDQTICSASTQLAATPVSGGVWSLVSGTGSFTNSALANTSVTGLSVGVNVFRWTIPGGACASAFDEVSIVVDQNPTVSNAGTDQTICATTTTLAGNLPLVGSGFWTVVSGSATFANQNINNTGVSGLAVGINVLRWTISNGVCPVSNSSIVVFREVPPVAVAGLDQRICSNSVILQANPEAGAFWILASGTGNVINPGQANTAVQGLNAGISVFRWTVPGNACPASSDEVSITIDAPPSVAAAGPDQTICSMAATLSGNNPVTGFGSWSIISGNGNINNPTFPVSSVNNLSPGMNILRWTINNGVCPATFDDITINVLQAPSSANAGPDQEVCGNTTQLAATTPDAGSGIWTVINGSGSFSNPAARNTQVSGLTSGLNVFRWTVTNGICPVKADEVQISSFAPPTPANAGVDASICNNPLTLQGNIPVSGNGVWTIVSGSGAISNANLPNATLSDMQQGQITLRWTISNGSCPVSSDQVVYTVYNQPLASAGQNQLVCSSSINLSGNAVPGATGLWSQVSGSGNIQLPGSPQTIVSNIAPGINVFIWTLNNGFCPVSNDTIFVTRYSEPDVANAGPSFQTCASNANLNANVPQNGTGFWIVLEGTGIVSEPESPNTSITGLSPGKNRLIWTISNGTCNPKSDTLVITVDQNPTSANAGPDQNICGTNTALSALNPLVGSGLWTLVSGSGNIQIPNQSVTAVSNLGLGLNIFKWTVSNGSCITSDEVRVTRFQPPSSANAGLDQNVCSSSIQLNADPIITGIGLWTVVSGASNPANVNNRLTSVSDLSYGANVFRWTVSNGACPSNSDEVTIFRQAEPGPAQVGADTSICSADIQLSARVPVSGTGIWSLISGAGEINDPLSPGISLSNLGNGNNVFRWTVINGDCPAVSDEITVSRYLPPSVANAGNDVSTCSEQVDLSANFPQTGLGSWTRINGLGNLLEPGNPETPVLNLIPGISIFEWRISNGPCPDSHDQVQVEVFSPPGTPDAGLDFQICGDSAFVAGNFSPNARSSWTVLSGNGVFEQPEQPQSAVNSLNPGENVLLYTFENGPCKSVDTIRIVSFVAPAIAFAGNDTAVCQPEFFPQPEIPANGVGKWLLLSGDAEINDAENPFTSILLPSAGQYIFSWEISNGTCTSVFDSLVVFRDIQADTASLAEDLLICKDSVVLEAKILSASSSGFWSFIEGSGVFGFPDSSLTPVYSLESGLNSVVWEVRNGSCVSSDTLTIELFQIPDQVNAGVDRQICGFFAEMEAETSSSEQGVWFYDESLSTMVNSEDPLSSLEVYQEGAIDFVWQVSNGPCKVSDSVTYTFIWQPESDAGDDIVICSGDTAYLQANIPDAGVSTWSLISGEGVILQPFFQNSEFIPEEEGNYYLRWTVVNASCRDSDLVVVSVKSPNDPFCSEKGTKLFVPEGFSPNGDGVFDQFVIQKPSGSRLSLQVFDRYGNKVFESSDYQNDWDGRASNGLIIHGDQLPESTYFYLLKVEGSEIDYKGYFTLWR
jgi:gliding motility-associated-like protein